MKKIIPLLIFCLGTLFAKAQCNMFMYGVVNNVICNGTNTGSYQIDTSLLAGVAPYTFASTPAATYNPSGLISGLSAGTYTIIASDAAGCTVSTTLNVSQPASPLLINSAQIITLMPTCTNSCDGSMDVTATGGVLPYVYSISPLGINDTSGQFLNLCPGAYTVHVTDAVGCTASIVEYLSPINPMYVTLTPTNPSSCGLCDGQLNINVVGGFGAYSYMVNSMPPTSNSLITNLCAGSYNVLVQDGMGCIELASTNLNSGSVTVSTISTNNPSCAGSCNGTAIFQAVGGTGPYTYAITPNVGFQASPGYFTSLCQGTYTITATDQNGCSGVNVVVIIDPIPLNIAAIADTLVCGQANYINAYSSGGTPPLVYNLIPVSMSNTTGQFNFPLAATTYTVTVTDAMSCTVTTTVNPIVLSNALMGVAVTSIPYHESCYYSNDGGIDLTVTPSSTGLSFAWDSGDITEDIYNAHSGDYTVKISNANGDCITHSETVSSNGSNCGTASGKIIYDVNGSCIQDPGDYAVSNRHVQLGGGALAITNNQGVYTFSNIGLNTHAISQTLNTPFVANACTQPTSFTLSSTNTNVTGLDFSDSLVNFVDAGVFMLNSGIVPGFGGSYYLYAHNNSNVSVNVNLSFVLSNLLTYSGSSITPLAVNPSAAGDSISWALTLPPLSQNTLIEIQFNTPSTLVAGMPFLSRGHIQVTSAADVNAANNVYQYTAISTSSFDPNVKNVNPPGEGPNGNITLQDKVLDYTVHFQNTGTSAAHRVIILDTLSSRVDISTLEVMAYSHNYKIEVLGTNVLKFTFDNIMLPDSNSNEPESHGYISYRILQSALNQLGHQIKNSASIYFDFNAPVVTNTTLNTIVAPTNINNAQKQPLVFAIYPNPTKDQCTLSWVGQESGSMQVQIITSIGQVIRTQTVFVQTGENEIALNVQGLTPGLYNIRLQQGEFQGNKSLLIK